MENSKGHDPKNDMDDMSFPHPNCLPSPMGCLDVTQCLGIGLDRITWPKVRQMREVWRELVMRTARSPNRRIRDELLKEKEWPAFGTWFNLHTQDRHSMCRSAYFECALSMRQY